MSEAPEEEEKIIYDPKTGMRGTIKEFAAMFAGRIRDAARENVSVRCLMCATEFVTSQDSLDDAEACCPTCGGHAVGGV